MKRLSIKLGYWSSLICAFTFIVYTACFIAILITSPVFVWTNMEDYAGYISQNSQIFKYIAQFMMIIFGVGYLVLTVSIFGYSSDEKKPLAKLSVFFALLFVAMISIHYFVQISAARIAFSKGITDGYEHFIQGNPYSIMSAINMLGWTLFFGLSSLFAAPVLFRSGSHEKLAGLFFYLNAAFCFLGGIGYVFELPALVFLGITLGMGASVLVITISLFLMFRKIGKQALDT